MVDRQADKETERQRNKEKQIQISYNVHSVLTNYIGRGVFSILFIYFFLILQVPNLPLLEPPLVPTHQTFSTFNSTAVYSQATMGHAGPGMGMGTGAGGIVSSAAASVISLFRGFGGAQNK